MKLFVTGSTGFVGSHFVKQAMAAGHDVVGLRRSSQSRPRIPLAAEPTWLDRPLDQLCAADFAGVDVLVHLAAHTPNVPYDTLENCMHWNVAVPSKMIRLAAEAGVRRMLVAGSCFEYGLSAERYEFLPVDAPLEPTLSYPCSKAAASIAFRGLASELGLQMRLFRLFQVYGEGEQESRFWPSLRKAAHEGLDFAMSAGDQLRDFVNVEMAAAQFVAGLEFRDVKAGRMQIGHVGSGTPQTLGPSPNAGGGLGMPQARFSSVRFLTGQVSLCVLSQNLVQFEPRKESREFAALPICAVEASASKGIHGICVECPERAFGAAEA